jgi:hypothetical protein
MPIKDIGMTPGFAGHAPAGLGEYGMHPFDMDAFLWN